jgi:hypothetical protein
MLRGHYRKRPEPFRMLIETLDQRSQFYGLRPRAENDGDDERTFPLVGHRITHSALHALGIIPSQAG